MEFSGSAAEEPDSGNQKVSIAAPLEIKIPDVRGGDGSSFGVPQPLDCLQGSPVPPFLSKTYDLVDDPALDGIISWGASGESFVVWDPIDFSRIVLPRNFKHNNFSSFVRQLNTYRFRKIDTDKWEFANKGFIRGKKHLLKSIQRRNYPQSQQDSNYPQGIYAEAGRPGLDEEVEMLKKERKMLMHEVAELQIEQQGTAHHMQLVNQRIQIAEKKQKQMVTFLSKMFQNPAILARLNPKNAPTQIESPNMKRKFITQHPHVAGGSCQNVNKDRAKSLPEQIKPRETSIMIENPSVSIPQLPGYLLEDLIGRIDGGGETSPAFMKEDFLVTELPTSKELEELDEFIMMPEDMDAMLTNSATRDSAFKGKGKVEDLDTPDPDYLVSFSEDIGMEKAYHRFSNSGTESSLKHEDVWSMGFDANMVMSNPSNSLRDNVADYNMPEFGASSSISGAWEFSTMHAAGCSGLELGSSDECTFDDLDIQVDQTEDGATKYMDN